jgi:pimeloyl-ACP methyl ester carboxylesterase
MFTLNLTTSNQPRRTTVAGAQNVQLAVQEWGNSDGPPILFAHAFGMSHLGWLPQINSELAQNYRLVTFDHRGHGESDKPLTPEAYTNGDFIADDIHAVINELKLVKPLLVGWSMSGALLGDYLTKYGEANVSGVALIAAANKLGAALFTEQAGPAFQQPEAQGIFSDHLLAAIPAWNFVNRRLTTEEAAPATNQIVLATSLLFPVIGRQTILSRDANFLPIYQKLSVPIHLFHAADDELVLPAASEALLAANPNAQLTRFAQGGHAPHWEHAAQVNQKLGAFAAAAFNKRHRT